MTEKQMAAVKERMRREIQVYAPDTEISFARFPVRSGGRDEWEQSED
jgi:hypothetical protein